jgi:hypothetical protein
MDVRSGEVGRRPPDLGAGGRQGPAGLKHRSAPLRRFDLATYILVIVKVPVPEQPVPVMVQVPVMVFPFAVPVRLTILPAGFPEFTVNPKVPFTLPLVFPVRVNVPAAVSPETKQGELLAKVKLEMLSDPSLFTTSDVPKVNASTLFESVNVAFHVPLMVAGLVLFEPQPTKVRPTASNTALPTAS